MPLKSGEKTSFGAALDTERSVWVSNDDGVSDDDDDDDDDDGDVFCLLVAATAGVN